MCGIFGIVVEKKINKNDFKKLALLSRERGKDSSGFLTHHKEKYLVKKFNRDIKDVFADILPNITRWGGVNTNKPGYLNGSTAPILFNTNDSNITNKS